MRGVLLCAVLAVCYGGVLGDTTGLGNVKPPQVYVYTRHPYKVGEQNELICHCTNFHPPRIDLHLKESDKEFKDCNQSDMTFKEDWAYYITKSVKFTPQEGVQYSCEVIHSDEQPKTYILDPMM